jgi:hypothetical protein
MNAILLAILLAPTEILSRIFTGVGAGLCQVGLWFGERQRYRICVPFIRAALPVLKAGLWMRGIEISMIAAIAHPAPSRRRCGQDF